MDTPWTSKTVGEALIDAFRRLPGRPCLSRGTHLVEGHAPPEAVTLFNAVTDGVPDLFERRTILTWARCRAMGESWSERCATLGWPRSSAEGARTRAADRVAAWLTRDSLPGSPVLTPVQDRSDP